MSKADDENLDLIGISELLEPAMIRLDMAASDKWDALEMMVDTVIGTGRIPPGDRAALLASIAAQEQRQRSDIKNGVAAPAASIDRVLTRRGLEPASAILLAGRFPNGVDYGARDHQPVTVILLFLLPRGRFRKWAPGLPQLARLFENGTLTQRLLRARSSVEFVEAIEQAEGWEHAMDTSHTTERPLPLPLPPMVRPRPGALASPPEVHFGEDEG